MEKRNLVNDLGNSLTDKIKELNIRFERVCGDTGYILSRYNSIYKEPTRVIEELFFEKVSQPMQERFIKCSLSIRAEEFYEIYKKIGKNGIRSFVNCIENKIALI